MQMQDSVAAAQSAAAAAWRDATGSGGSTTDETNGGQPAMVTLAMLDPMLQCQMCSQRFSMSGKLSDLHTPVLAVNPSHSIEGPYCIACAGKRDGLRSFFIDEARVALCKLWHQQLSMGAAYAAYVNQHQQAHAVAAMAAAHAQAAAAGAGGAGPPTTGSDSSSASGTAAGGAGGAGGTSAVAADITRRMAQAKRDAPGLNGTSGSGQGSVGTGKRRASLLNEEKTALAMPAGDEHRHGTYPGILGQHPSLHQQQQQQLNSNNSNNNANRGYPQYFTHITTNTGAAAIINNNSNANKRQRMNHPYISSSSNIKTTWTEAEDAILIEAVTTSQEQPFTRWSDLAHQLPGRVGKQIRDRWLNHLDPRIDRSPFTRDEDFKLYTAYKKHGKRWVEISTKFFDCKRSENHVKNRWYSAAFKKFVRQEIGEDPFDGTANSDKNNNKTSGSGILTSNSTTNNNNNRRKKPAEESPTIAEEKKDD